MPVSVSYFSVRGFSRCNLCVVYRRFGAHQFFHMISFWGFLRSWVLAAVILSQIVAIKAHATESFHDALPDRLRIALLGDSITRGVLADRSLGGEATLSDYFLVAQLLFGVRSVSMIPEGEGVLNWQLMKNNEILARDHLAAVQGESLYSVKTRLEKLGVQVEVVNVAQLGASFRTGDSQIALLQKSYQSGYDIVIVDLGRIDFSLFTELSDFRNQVRNFFTKLKHTTPESHILVTRIADIPSNLNRPDRVGMRLLGGQTINCSAVFQGGVAAKTRLVPGQDNSPYIGAAIQRWQDMNQVISEAVDQANLDGMKARFINTIPDRQPELWDEVMSSDCIHFNELGQSQIADRLLQEILVSLSFPKQAIAGEENSNNSGDQVTHEERKSLGFFDDRSMERTAQAVSDPQQASIFPPEAEAAWRDYESQLDLSSLQDGCQPRIIRPSPSALNRGIVVLYHGYSACPQQFEDVGLKLANAGYHVLLPLLPGHGRKFAMEGDRKIDDYSALPQFISQSEGGSTELFYQKAYLSLAAQMNQVASHTGGHRIIGGLSTGAVAAALTTLLRSDLWDRQIIMSPMFEINQTLLRNIMGTINNTDRNWARLLEIFKPLLEKPTGWGEGCEKERDLDFLNSIGRDKIRAGICQFLFTHAASSNQLGYDVWEMLRPTMIKTQVIAVQDDPLVHLPLTYNAVGKWRGEDLKQQPYTSKKRLDEHPQVRVCYLPSRNDICLRNLTKPLQEQQKPCVNHSLLSRYDTPQQNKYWISTLEDKIVSFVANEEFLKGDSRKRVHGDPICQGF